MSAHKQYLVVGAGLSGLVMANLLSEDINCTVTVIERKGCIGGLCCDQLVINGIRIQ